VPDLNTQTAPFPVDLAELVDRLRYRPGWRAALQDIVRDPETSHGAEARGLTFIVTTLGYDSYHPERGEHYRVNHYFPVPAATYNRASWLRWLLDCMLKVEQHECCEFFAQVVSPEPEDDCAACGHQATRHDGRDSTCHEDGCANHRFVAAKERVGRPFAPTHGPGDDPYVIHEYASDEQMRTRFTGEIASDNTPGGGS
jgi:hypothetical protein